MAIEEELVAVMRAARHFVPMRPLRGLCTSASDMASRLYVFRRPMAFAVTAVAASTGSIELLELGEPPTIMKVLAVEPASWKVSEAPVRIFHSSLDALGIWTKPDYRANTRDGMVCFHCTATVDREYGFSMFDPVSSEDPGYKEIVKLYVREFLQTKRAVRALGLV